MCSLLGMKIREIDLSHETPFISFPLALETPFISFPLALGRGEGMTEHVVV